MCAILKDGYVSHTFSDTEVFASVSNAHGLYNMNCVWHKLSYTANYWTIVGS
jgi:hypothetical protein